MGQAIISTLDNEGEDILYGLDAWTEYLSARDLPARASTLKRLKQLINNDLSTVKQLSEVVKKDPVLTLYVVREAQLKHSEKNSVVKSILHAVTSLGYDGVKAIADQIQPMSLNPTNVQQKRFLHAIATSHHAAYQVQEWMHFKKLPLIDESYFAALFYSIGFWALWLHAPLHMQKIQTRVHENNEHPIDVENDILGCSMQMISEQLAVQWQLSKLTQQAQSHETSPSLTTLKKLHKRAQKDPNLSHIELRSLNHITQQKHFPIKLANWFSLTASRDWYSKETLSNIDLVSDYLQIPVEKTTALLHRTCAQSSRDYFAPGISAPGAQLLFIPSDIRVHYKMGAKELAMISEHFPAPEIPMILPIDIDACKAQYQDIDFFELIDRHLKASTNDIKFKKVPQVLSAFLKGLEKGLGIAKMALFTVNTKSQTIKTVQTLGFDEEHPLKSISINYTEKDKLFDLCNAPSYVVFDTNTAKKLSDVLPSSFLRHCSQSFMLTSIFRANQAIVIAYIDMNDEEIPNFIRERVKYLSHSASFALAQI